MTVATAKTLDELNALDAEWTEYTKAFTIAAVDETKVIVYAKITDNVGNVTFISSDGVAFDTEAPIITGVANLGIYKTDLTIHVADTHLDSVALNGQTVDTTIDDDSIGATIQVTAGTDAAYTLVATDLAGNTTTVIFYTYVENIPVEDVLENLPTVDDFTTDDEKEEIQNVVNSLLDAYLDDLNSEEGTSKDEETIIQEVNKLEQALLESTANISVVATIKVVEDNVAEDKKSPEVNIIPQGLAVAIYGSDMYTEALANNANIELSLSVTQTSGSENGFVFEIKPTISIDGSEPEIIPNTCINAPVTFKLYLNDSFKGTLASIEHVKEDNTSAFYENLLVYTDEYGKYVIVTVYEFSNFIVTEYRYELLVDGVMAEYKASDTVTLQTPTKEGYEFIGWVSSDVSIVDGTFQMPDQNVVITSSWKATTTQGDTPSDDTTSDDTSSDDTADDVKSPYTGDHFNRDLWTLFLCGSLCALAGVGIYKQRKSINLKR